MLGIAPSLAYQLLKLPYLTLLLLLLLLLPLPLPQCVAPLR